MKLLNRFLKDFLFIHLDNKSFNTPIIEKGYLIGFNVDNNILECQGFSK